MLTWESGRETRYTSGGAEGIVSLQEALSEQGISSIALPRGFWSQENYQKASDGHYHYIDGKPDIHTWEECPNNPRPID